MPRDTIDYEDQRPLATRKRLVRSIFIVIILKVVLVIANVAMAILAAPAPLRVGGIAGQIALTLVFFALLLRLVSLPRTLPARDE